MKKLLALILTVLVCAGCFAGCTGENQETKAKAKADKDDVIIKVWSTEAGAQAVWEELVDEWNATTGEEKNIYINWVTTTDSQKVDVAQQNGQLPNIFNVNGKQLKKFVAGGDLMPINDLPDGEKFLEEYGQAGLEGSNYKDGKQYSVYMNVRTAGLIINKDLFKKAGIVDENGEVKAPKTMSELREAAKKITNTKEQIYGYAFPLKFGLTYTTDYPVSTSFEEYGSENAVKYIDLDKLEVTFPGYKDMYQWLLDLRDDGSLFPGAETLDNDTARAYFSQGKIGMFPAISWDVGVYTDQFPAQCDWDVYEFPLLDGHKNTGNYWNQRGGGMVIGKMAADKHPEETMEVYKFIYSLESRTRLFERGINLSCKTDVLENIDESKVDPKFLKFAKLVDENKRYANHETYTSEGEQWKDLFVKVWQNQMTLDEAIKKFEKSETDGLRRSVEKGIYSVERQKNVNKYLNGDDNADITKTNW